MALLLINGRDCSNYIWYSASTRWNLMRGARGTATLPLIIPPDDTFAPQIDDAVTLYDPSGTAVWSGTVEALRLGWLGDDGWHVITLTCVSLEQLYDTATLDKIEYAAPLTCGAVVSNLHSRSGVTAVTLGTIADGPIVQALQVSNVAQGFADLALLAGFVWYVDPADNTLNFHAPDARAAAWTLESDDVLWETLDYAQSRADYRDTQYLQLPGVAQGPVTATFDGDTTTTEWVLPSVPGYLISVDVLPGGKGTLSIAWVPGNDFITVIPAMLHGTSMVVKYAAVSGQSTISNADAGNIGIGSKTLRNTKTRTYTADGGLQETTAIIARYSMLPSTLQVSTDRAGVGIARALTIDLTAPASASTVLNGVWLVVEIEAVIVPGLEMRPSPFGHFRYTLHLVNTAATAVFRGDGSTTAFTLPEVPASVPLIRVVNTDLPITGAWTIGTDQIVLSAPLPEGAGVAVDYRGADFPDVPNFISTLENMPGSDGAGSTTVAPDPLATVDVAPVVFTRTLTLFDTTVTDDAVPHTPVYHDGIGLRVLGVLRKAIASDLTVRILKENVELTTVTLTSANMVDEVVEWSLATGSPAVLDTRFFDKEVLSADVLESDGSTDVNGIAQFTVEWTYTA